MTNGRATRLLLREFMGGRIARSYVRSKIFLWTHFKAWLQSAINRADSGSNQRREALSR